jgi:hypothetical protein
MHFLSALFDPSFLAELLSNEAKASLTEKIIVVMIVWWVMGRKVSEHFKSLEGKLDLLIISIAETKAALSQRMDSIEERVEKVEKQ